MSAVVARRSAWSGLAALAVVAACATRAEERAAGDAPPPNVILCMSDDQGWGDTGFAGHPILRTPHLDAMARAGLRFRRFYSGAPVCSPTRGSCLTGRHPYRYGIFHANVGHLPAEEITLAEALRTRGYATGHFGKWHLGTLTRTERDSNRGGPDGADHYAPPWDHGFDVCFSTEAKVPTWDPMRKPGTSRPYGTAYWTGEGRRAEGDLEGDDSRVVMDRALGFIGDATARRQPFLAVIWFHAPHEPVVGGADYLARYPEVAGEKARHYYACLTAMDEQVGRLRAELDRIRAAENTMLWFCADNGPEHEAGPGSTGGLRGRKRDLLEGGVRVPGLLVWPARVRAGRTTDIPASTSDLYPTVLEVLGLQMEGQPVPIDGVSLVPLIDERLSERPRPIAFESRKQVALVGDRYKLLGKEGTGAWQLYDLVTDPGETRDLAADQPVVAEAMRTALESWRTSCAESRAGRDYR